MSDATDIISSASLFRDVPNDSWLVRGHVPECVHESARGGQCLSARFAATAYRLAGAGCERRPTADAQRGAASAAGRYVARQPAHAVRRGKSDARARVGSTGWEHRCGRYRIGRRLHARRYLAWATALRAGGSHAVEAHLGEEPCVRARSLLRCAPRARRPNRRDRSSRTRQVGRACVAASADQTTGSICSRSDHRSAGAKSAPVRTSAISTSRRGRCGTRALAWIAARRRGVRTPHAGKCVCGSARSAAPGCWVATAQSAASRRWYNRIWAPRDSKLQIAAAVTPSALASCCCVICRYDESPARRSPLAPRA